MENKVKIKLIIIIFLSFSFTFIACEEEPPAINFKPKDHTLLDTTYISTTDATEQLRNVLIEDFTGIRCINCPDAAKIIEGIVQNNPHKVFVIANHVTDAFGKPYTKSKEDYRIKEGEDILNLMGGTTSLPTGAICREKFANQTSILISRYNWVQYTDSILSRKTPLNIEVKNTYNNKTRELITKVKIHYTAPTNGKQYLSVSLIESGMIDLQADGGHVVDNYEHKHTLRAMMTTYNGELLKNNPEKNRVFEREFKIKLKAERFDKILGKNIPAWKAENCEVIAFVHNRDAVKKDFEVLQVVGKKVK